MKNSYLKKVPKCIEHIGEEVFLKVPIYKRKDKAQIVYINEELYEKYFNKPYHYEEAKKELEELFNITINENYRESEEIIGYGYVDKQKDETDIALNGNTGSGRAYYICENFNLKGDKTPFATSKLTAYNNGKLSLDSAIHEGIISNLLNKTGEYECFKTLAIFSSNEYYKFPLNTKAIPCGFIIRVYEENELYRFSHRFVNKKVFDKNELIDIAQKIGILEGNKFIDRFLHGAWSTGNLSIEGNLIDLDTSYFLEGRHPQWCFSEKYKTNFFGYEHLGQIKIMENIINSSLNIDNVEQVYINEIIYTYRFNQIKKRFIELMGVKNLSLEKYDKQLNILTEKFIKLSQICYENFDDLFVLSSNCNKTYIFDFSRFFKYYEILKQNNEFNLITGLKLLLNQKAMFLNYSEKYEYMKKFFEEINIKNENEYFQKNTEAVEFIKAYDRFNNLIKQNEKIDLNAKLKYSYIVNSDRNFLFAREFIRDELIYLYNKNGSEFSSKYISRIIDLYSYKDLKYCDLKLFVEGIFYKEITDDCKIKYNFEFFNRNITDECKMLVNNYEIAVEIIHENNNSLLKTKDSNSINLPNDSELNIAIKINGKTEKITKIGKKSRFEAV